MGVLAGVTYTERDALSGVLKVGFYLLPLSDSNPRAENKADVLELAT